MAIGNYHCIKAEVGDNSGKGKVPSEELEESGGSCTINKVPRLRIHVETGHSGLGGLLVGTNAHEFCATRKIHDRLQAFRGGPIHSPCNGPCGFLNAWHVRKTDEFQRGSGPGDCGGMVNMGGAMCCFLRSQVQQGARKQGVNRKQILESLLGNELDKAQRCHGV